MLFIQSQVNNVEASWVYTGVNDSYSQISAFRCPPLYCEENNRVSEFLSRCPPHAVAYPA
jgi:hypothetical protein